MYKGLTIFLDFNGCLNSLPYLQMIEKQDWAKLNFNSDQSWKEEMHKYLNPDNIECFSNLIESVLKYGVRVDIVIHSSWRHFYTLDKLRDILLKAGFGYYNDFIEDVTPIHIKDRGESIRWYLKHHNIGETEYIIIEDLQLDADLAPRQIKTEWLGNGFDDEKLEEAFKLLGIDS